MTSSSGSSVGSISFLVKHGRLYKREWTCTMFSLQAMGQKKQNQEEESKGMKIQDLFSK